MSNCNSVDPDDVALGQALIDFFTNEVDLPDCPAEVANGAVWWERRSGWEYPWRIVERVDGVAQGYPCGEPRKVVR